MIRAGIEVLAESVAIALLSANCLRSSSCRGERISNPATGPSRRSMARKRTSKRRWKARCRLGRMIPAVAIVDWRLDRWFSFHHMGLTANADVWLARAIPKLILDDIRREAHLRGLQPVLQSNGRP